MVQSAPLLAAYGSACGPGRAPTILLVFTTQASLDSLSNGTACLVTRKTPFTFTPKIQSHSSTVTFSKSRAAVLMLAPALLQSTSRRPNLPLIAAIRPITLASSATSHWTTSVSAPCASHASAVLRASPLLLL